MNNTMAEEEIIDVNNYSVYTRSYSDLYHCNNLAVVEQLFTDDLRFFRSESVRVFSRPLASSPLMAGRSAVPITALPTSIPLMP